MYHYYHLPQYFPVATIILWLFCVIIPWYFLRKHSVLSYKNFGIITVYQVAMVLSSDTIKSSMIFYNQEFPTVMIGNNAHGWGTIARLINRVQRIIVSGI